ncbi:MAG: lactate racemase domain-containing protein [Pseudomonadota bacterium]
MDVVKDLVDHIRLPDMVPVRQIFDDTHIADLETHLAHLFAASALSDRVKPGETVALGVGSRGLAHLPALVRATVDALKSAGALPFLVPAMGSHGGATAEGQVKLLAGLGVDEASAGCPIRSSMETVEIGRLDGGLAVLMDKLAMSADHIAFINRVKPHTSYSGAYESGLAKMLAIGLANHHGAEACHAEGFGAMARNVEAIARMKLTRAPILFGLATVENPYDRIARAELVFGEEMMAREPALLEEARTQMPRLLFGPLDVLVVDTMGKEFSGTGMDPHITGKAGTPFVHPTQSTSRLVVLDLSLKSGGNATGLGLADICTQALFGKIDFRSFYANHLTSTVMTGAKVPMMMASSRMAVQAAIKTCNAPEPARPQVVRIPNTLHIEHVEVCQSLVETMGKGSAIDVLGEPRPWSFDDEPSNRA